MKIFHKIIGACSIALAVSACSLEETPYGFLSTDNFYKTASDAQSALVYCYSFLPEVGYYSRALHYVPGYASEEYVTKSDGGLDVHQLVDWTVDPSNTLLDGVFKDAYMGIDRCNTLISHVPGINMDTITRNQYVGEAYFLRALHYFNLVRLFGSVPIRTEPITSSNQVAVPKSSISDVYDVIISDLQKAEQLMTSNFIECRANKIAAEGLLSKVYLTMASSKATGCPGYDFVSDANSYYSKAAAEAAKVLDPSQSTYTFWTGDLTAMWDIDNEVGNEFIFSIGVDKSGKAEGNYSKLSMNMVPYVNGAKISLGPSFNVTIPDGWSQTQTNIPFYNTFSSNDKRRDAWIVKSVKLSDGSIRTYPGELAYPFTLKYIDKTQTGEASGHYIPVLRYSDVALIYAEAAGPSDSKAYSWVNKVRNRAGLPDLTTGLSTEAFRDSVLKERSFELCFEMNRFYDLRRTHNIEAVLNGIYGKNIHNSDAYAYFYPIPQREIDNNPALNSK